MSHESFQDAVKVLRNRMNGRWDGAEADGRDAMVDALKTDLGYSSGRANQMIDAMIDAGTIRYRHDNSIINPDTPDDSDMRTEHPDALDAGLTAGAAMGGLGVAGASALGGQGGMPVAAPLAVGVITGSGYWQIGDADTEGSEKAPMEGRAGQIDPTS